jgi:hypothetical protein
MQLSSDIERSAFSCLKLILPALRITLLLTLIHTAVCLQGIIATIVSLTIVSMSNCQISRIALKEILSRPSALMTV